jgi:outer membrane lipoprotein-sorting protein
MKLRIFVAALCIILFAGCGGDSSRQQATPIPESPQDEESALAPVAGVSTFKAAVAQESFEIVKHKTTGWVYYKHPDSMRIELSMLDPASQILIIYTPDVLWEYDPKNNVAERTDVTQLKAEFPGLKRSHFTGYIVSDVSQPSAPKHRYDEYDFQQLRSETLYGAETRVYETCHRNKEGKEISRVVVWVGAEDNFLRKKIEYLVGKKSLEELFYNVEVNSTLPDSLFHFTPPQGAKLIDRTEAYRRTLQAHDRLRKKLNR